MQKLKIEPTGFFRVLWTSKRSQVATMVLRPGAESSGGMETHAGDQVTYCLEGTGTVETPNGSAGLGPGELLTLEAGERHRFVNSGPTDWKVLVFYAPPEY
jgi:mannose-6-phosphate isomerase-like protein (cupin superfamily)